MDEITKEEREWMEQWGVSEREMILFRTVYKRETKFRAAIVVLSGLLLIAVLLLVL